MSLTNTTFGPCRAIGVRYAGKSENQEITKLWESFLTQHDKIAKPAGAGAFGVCRCLPGVRDGSFEYIAAFAALADAPVPEGMMAIDIPEGDYLVHRFENVRESMKEWGEAARQLAADTEWTGFCGGERCECATHPCFEYYPPEFNGTGPVLLYMSVQPK